MKHLTFEEIDSFEREFVQEHYAEYEDIRIILKMARESISMYTMLRVIHAQPFNGSWDRQAIYIQEHLAALEKKK